MIKACKITFKSINGEGETLDIAEHRLHVQNIRMGEFAKVGFPERSIVIPENRLNHATINLAKNGCEIVKIEEGFEMSDLTYQEAAVEKGRIEKLIQPLTEYYSHMQVVERVVGKRCIIGVHIVTPGWYYLFIENPTELVKHKYDENVHDSSPMFTLKAKNFSLTVNNGDTPNAEITVLNGE